MSTVIKLRRDSIDNWGQYTLAEGEIGIAISGSGTGSRVTEFRIGDGHSSWAQLGQYQNWQPTIQRINIGGKSATGSNGTASIDLDDVYAPYSSRILSASGSYNVNNGVFQFGVKNGLNSYLSSSVTISKVASASLANVLQTQYVQIQYSGSSGVLEDGDDYYYWSNMAEDDPYSVVKLVNSTGDVPSAIILESNAEEVELMFNGRAKTAYSALKASQDSNGNTITSSYLRKNGSSSGSQTISGSINVSATVTADKISGSKFEINSGSQQVMMYDPTSGWGNVVGFSIPVVMGDGLNVNETSWFEYLTVGNDGITSAGSIHCEDNIYAEGDVIAAWASDRRLKKNVEPISSLDADEVLEALKPVEFEWNEKAEELSEGHKTGKARGFLADEFLEVLPNAGRKIWHDYDAIEYNQVIPYLVAGYQSLKKEVEELKKEIAELKARS